MLSYHISVNQQFSNRAAIIEIAAHKHFTIMKYSDFLNQLQVVIADSAKVVCTRSEDWFAFDKQILLKLNKELPSCTFHKQIPNNWVLVEFDSIIGVLEQIPEASFITPLLESNVSWLSVILANANINFVVRHVEQGEDIFRNYEDSVDIIMSESIDLVYVTNIVLSDIGKDALTQIRNQIIDGTIKL